jgi:hypothetical protein
MAREIEDLGRTNAAGWRPQDLDCADIPHRRFTVLPPDPHRFDGDGDGIGCESG